MHYITVTELESPGATSCKIQGLTTNILRSMKLHLLSQHINHSHNEMEKFIEIDVEGIFILNFLSSEHSYRVIGQSMVIEESNVGGRTDKVHKTLWTLGRI